MKSLLALLLALSVTANAQIAVYRNAITYTRIGDESVQIVGVSGYTLISLASSELVFIAVDAKHKTFHEESPEFQAATIHNSAVRTYAVVKFTSGTIVSAVAKGLNANVVTDHNPVTKQPITSGIPVAMTVTGSDILTSNDSGEYVTRDYHGLLTYDQLDTFAANKISANVSTYAGVIESRLLANGYTAN